MELKIEHILPYLLYSPKVEILNYKSDYVGIRYSELNGFYNLWLNPHFTYSGGSTGKSVKEFKIFLRPLSEIQSYFTPLFDSDIDVRTFLNEDFLKGFGIETIGDLLNLKVEWYPVGLYNLLLKHNFDVFGLIENGLAVDINLIEKRA